MTVVMIGKKGKKGTGMEFEFESAMDAFTFYAMTKDSYREDDLVIAMVEEGDKDEV